MFKFSLNKFLSFIFYLLFIIFSKNKIPISPGENENGHKTMSGFCLGKKDMKK